MNTADFTRTAAELVADNDTADVPVERIAELIGVPVQRESDERMTG